MTGIVEAVADILDQRCMVGRLRKEGCKVSLKDAPEPRLIVDFDKPGSPLEQNQTRCDYLFVADSGECVGWIAPLELKRGSLQAGEVVRQLRAGAKAAEKFVSPNEKMKFRPTAAFGNIHRAEITKLKEKIRFHGHVEAIRLIKCGDSLRKALGA